MVKANLIIQENIARPEPNLYYIPATEEKKEKKERKIVRGMHVFAERL